MDVADSAAVAFQRGLTHRGVRSAGTKGAVPSFPSSSL